MGTIRPEDMPQEPDDLTPDQQKTHDELQKLAGKRLSTGAQLARWIKNLDKGSSETTRDAAQQ